MIRIHKSNEPNCLVDLRENSNDYSDLRDECRSEVLDSLKTEQVGICAYCQKEVNTVIEIEHYIPQSIDEEKVLIYENFLGVCSGFFYVDKNTGEKIDYCSRKRGNQELFLNPMESEDMDTIYYDENNKILSSNVKILYDLEQTLNLNFTELCDKRGEAFQTFLLNLYKLKEILGLSKVDFVNKAIQLLSVGNTEYSGIIKFRLKQLISESS
ncbi:hypothetical protein [uncultured Aquimarina sp.]|uniref:hypothetical protein n=1 Tax=uncultured Aquimarina sp. TaxID=575652 RepID=UPI0026236F9F|nr:hypothetical protein [uncultured Aquimarina sp.]